MRSDPGAFLCTEHHGAVVATGSCALYGDDYAFIGFYIVHEDFRGRGSGSRCSSARWRVPATGSSG